MVSSPNTPTCFLLNSNEPGRRLSNRKSMSVTGWTYVATSTRRNIARLSSILHCIVFHLQTVFDEDTVEHQQIYISSYLKNPQRVTVCTFFTHVEQLNSYIKYLPSIYNSPKATESTQLAVPYTEAQFVVQLLCMCPVHWQNQYDTRTRSLKTHADSSLFLRTLRSLVQVPPYPRVPPAETTEET
jgi:hypothetical protein